MSDISATTDVRTTGRQASFDSFLAEAKALVTNDQLHALTCICDLAEERSWNLVWGPGDTMSSFSIGISAPSGDQVLTVWQFGQLSIDFDQLNANTIEEGVLDSLAAYVNEHLECVKKEDRMNGYAIIEHSVWTPKVEGLISYLRTLTAIVCSSSAYAVCAPSEYT
jgi:hypothetical protein